jgi:GH25 family lysozyme M1 (1,4-beta-N-acetylmuramidase)
MLGVDFASVDGNVVDWTKAKNIVSFAFIRATFGDWVDPIYEATIKAIPNNIVKSAYLFLRFENKGRPYLDPVIQATKFIEVVKVADIDLPPVVDIEFPGNGRTDTLLSPTECYKRILAVYSTLKTHYKCEPIIYTSARVWEEDMLNHPAVELLNCPLWLARYTYKANGTGNLNPQVNTPPTPWGDKDNCWIHQYQGDAINVPGFSNTVDLNLFKYLTVGTHGGRVKWVQNRLGITADGVFGNETYTALKSFQKAKGLDVDGVVGPRTLGWLSWQSVTV